MTEFILITRDDCAFCEKAKAMMFDRGDAYHEMKIDEDITRDEVLEKYPSRKVLPIITLDSGEIVGGLTELLDYYTSMDQSNTYVEELLKTSPKGLWIRFEKKDGTIRDMRATLNSNLIPQNENVESSRPSNSEVQIVYDLEKNGWRSYRKDSLICYGQLQDLG